MAEIQSRMRTRTVLTFKENDSVPEIKVSEALIEDINRTLDEQNEKHYNDFMEEINGILGKKN
jgi:tetrahydromethanopterin S-methyltransferase subunit G